MREMKSSRMAYDVEDGVEKMSEEDGEMSASGTLSVKYSNPSGN